MTLWVEGREAQLQPVTGLLIIAKAERLSTALGLPGDSLRFSNGWVNKFKKRHALQHYQSHGEASSVDLTSIKEEHVRMQHELQGWDLNDVFNVDEMWRKVVAR